MQLKISYIDPTTNRKQKREYKLAPSETTSDAILFIYKALYFIYGENVVVKIEQ